MNHWIEICPLNEIPRQGARVVATTAGPVAVFRTVEDEVLAVLDRCPHKGGPLSQGIVHERRVTCPLHNWVIDLEAGAAMAPDDGCVTRFPVRVEQDLVHLQLTPV